MTCFDTQSKWNGRYEWPPSIIIVFEDVILWKTKTLLYSGSFLKLLIFIGEQDDVCTLDLLSEARGTQAYFSAEMLFEWYTVRVELLVRSVK